MSSVESPSRTGESRLLIGGQLREAASGATYDNVSPSTERVIGTTAAAGLADADAAIAAARTAFDETRWAHDATLRAACLTELYDALRDAADEMADVLVQEAGVPISLTKLVQYRLPVEDIPYWAELAQSYPYEQTMPLREIFGRPSQRLLRRTPAGVVAAITAWNFPVMLNLAKLIPALSAGCTIVLKPAPQTPWSATVLGRLIAEHTDIPAGVVNVLPSPDPAIGEQLTKDPRVDMVSFVGSTEIGKLVHAQSASTMKKTLLELGGKSANIVLDDADFAQILPAAAAGSCSHAGQGCGLLTRLLLPASRYDEGVEIVEKTFRALGCGDPADPATVVGPLVSDMQRTRVLGHIERGVADGARLLVGGERPAERTRGYYVQPTLFADVDPDSALAQEEIFGPVLSVLRYEDEDDAVRIANNSRYGLSGGVHSGSRERAVGLARRLRTGTVAVNGAHWLAPDSPFGGYKESGIGRENGVAGFEEYLETTVIGTPPTA